jgi:hypothetical protein
VLYTVASTYFATGEGVTLSVWIGLAQDQRDALEKFKAAITNGDFWAHGAETFEGVNTAHPACKYLLTPAVTQQMKDENCIREFHSQLHFNYS